MTKDAFPAVTRKAIKKKEENLTVREVEALNIDNLSIKSDSRNLSVSRTKAQRDNIKKFAVYRYPIPLRKFKNLNDLKRKINAFFYEDNVNFYNSKNEIVRVSRPEDRQTKYEFAEFIGYSSFESLKRAMDTHSEEEWVEWIRLALNRIKNRDFKEAKEKAREDKTSQGLVALLEFSDNEDRKLSASADMGNQGSTINVNINQEFINNVIDESMKALEIDLAGDAEATEIVNDDKVTLALEDVSV